MKKAILVSRDRTGDWSEWKVIYILKEHTNTYLIWSWSNLFCKYIHKKAMGVRVEEL